MDTEMREVKGARYLHDMSLYLQGARRALASIDHNRAFDDMTGKEAKVYNDAIYRLLMCDDTAMTLWLAGARNVAYSNHTRDDKGRLVHVTATLR